MSQILILIPASNYSLNHLIVFLYHCGHSSYHWSQSILMTSYYEHLLRCISSYLDFASKLCKICVNPVKFTSSPASVRIHSQPPSPLRQAYPQSTSCLPAKTAEPEPKRFHTLRFRLSRNQYKSSYFPAAALCPAIRPNTTISGRALPPTRLPA